MNRDPNKAGNWQFNAHSQLLLGSFLSTHQNTKKDTASNKAPDGRPYTTLLEYRFYWALVPRV